MNEKTKKIQEELAQVEIVADAAAAAYEDPEVEADSMRAFRVGDVAYVCALATQYLTREREREPKLAKYERIIASQREELKAQAERIEDVEEYLANDETCSMSDAIDRQKIGTVATLLQLALDIAETVADDS